MILQTGSSSMRKRFNITRDVKKPHIFAITARAFGRKNNLGNGEINHKRLLHKATTKAIPLSSLKSLGESISSNKTP